MSTRGIPENCWPKPQQSMWHVVYWYYWLGEDGPTHTVKGNTAGIRRAVQQGLLGHPAGIKASRTKEGPFEDLNTFPEFRDLMR